VTCPHECYHLQCGTGGPVAPVRQDRALGGRRADHADPSSHRALRLSFSVAPLARLAAPPDRRRDPLHRPRLHRRSKRAGPLQLHGRPAHQPACARTCRLRSRTEKRRPSHVPRESCHLGCRGAPGCIRADSELGFSAKRVREWLGTLSVTTPLIGPGSPRENGYVGSLNGSLRDELLSAEVFDAPREGQVLLGPWGMQYSAVRKHSSFGQRVLAGMRALPGLGASLRPSPAQGYTSRHSVPNHSC